MWWELATRRFVAPVSALALALSLACAAGCAQPATQLIVVVDTDLGVPAEVDDVQVTVSSNGGVMVSQHQALTSSSMLPRTLTVVPGGESLGPIDVVATGRHGTSTVVSRAARVTLVRGETRMLRLYLYARCVGTTCPSGQTCGESGCTSVEAMLEPWPGTPPGLHDAGTPRDAGPADAGPPRDANLPDAPTGCSGAAQCDDHVDCTIDDCAAGTCTHVASHAACSDGEECTTDTCDGTSGCAHAPASGPCSDGVFCNGLDQCSGGTCSMHAGDPCAAPTVCDDAAGVCRGCTSDANCTGMNTVGPWGSCNYADGCVETATRTRTARTFSCQSDSCIPHDTTEMDPCTRDTDGTGCGVGGCGGFGACDYVDACDESASQSRSCVDLACAAGVCRSTMRTETMGCSRTTSGMSCGGTDCTSYGACDYTDACDPMANQTRTCTDYACQGGSCVGNARTESQGCGRVTEGTSCGASRVCQGGACVCSPPVLSGGGGDVMMTSSRGANGSGSTLTFVDTASGGTLAAISIPGATLSGGGNLPNCIGSAQGLGDRIRLVDTDGTTAVTVLVSGVSVSGTFNPPCFDISPYGCFPVCLGRVSTSGSTMTLDSYTGPGSLSFGCP